MSIWGAVQNSTQLFRGCRFVSTSSHGGIILTANALAKNPLMEQLRTFPEIQSFDHNGTYYFEEDCEAHLVLYLLDDETLKQVFPNSTPERVRELALISFVQYNPSYFTHVTGKELSIFDSPKLWDDVIKSNPEHFFIRTAYSDSSYNVPTGHTYFIVENGKNESIGLIAPKAEYARIRALASLPVVVSNYQRFDHDEDMPMSKPRHRIENAFRVVSQHYDANNRDNLIVKAFSYQTNEFKYFLMTNAFYLSQRQAVDSSVWIAYTSAEHTTLTEDFDLFVQESDKAKYDAGILLIKFNKVA